MKKLFGIFFILLILISSVFIDLVQGSGLPLVSGEDTEVVFTDSVSGSELLWDNCPSGYSKIGEECMSDKVIGDLISQIEKRILRTLEQAEFEKQIQIKKNEQIAKLKPLCNYCWDDATIQCYNKGESIQSRTCILERNGNYIFETGKKIGYSCDTHTECLTNNCKKGSCKNVNFIENKKMDIQILNESENFIIKEILIEQITHQEQFEIYSKFGNYEFYNILIIPNKNHPKIRINDRNYLFIKRVNLSDGILNLDDKTMLIINDYNVSNISSSISKLKMTFIDSSGGFVFNNGNYYFCEGYYIYDKCHNTGDSFEMQNKTYYVINQTFEIKKDVGSSCEFDYECEAESCINKKCSLEIVEEKELNEFFTSITGEVVGTEEIVREESFLVKILNFLFGKWK